MARKNGKEVPLISRSSAGMLFSIVMPALAVVAYRRRSKPRGSLVENSYRTTVP